jgi:hypothetical protein
MRRAFNNPDFLYHDNKLVGVNLGFDFCAEHEWGVKGIREKLGIGEIGNPPGIQTRINTSNDVYLFHSFKRKGEKYAVMFSLTAVRNRYWGADRHNDPIDVKIKNYINDHFKQAKSWLGESLAGLRESEKERNKDNHITCQWAEEDFEIFVHGEEFVNNLKQIHEAYTAKNISLGGNYCGNSFTKQLGLSFFIVSNMPQEWIDRCMQADEEQIQIQKMVEDTKIKDILAKASKTYYALSPRFDANGCLSFWLNPCDQKNNNFGWYSVEDLKEWALGKGKIPKQVTV